mmetsp:Transcript_16562/g.25583  ORF Transcript_16562/g.25583 Transcript_16562/m.25583 type:complete len:211 (-) Transcript_16562:102-734(-)
MTNFGCLSLKRANIARLFLDTRVPHINVVTSHHHILAMLLAAFGFMLTRRKWKSRCKARWFHLTHNNRVQQRATQIPSTQLLVMRTRHNVHTGVSISTITHSAIKFDAINACIVSCFHVLELSRHVFRAMRDFQCFASFHRIKHHNTTHGITQHNQTLTLVRVHIQDIHARVVQLQIVGLKQLNQQFANLILGVRDRLQLPYFDAIVGGG